MLRAIRTRFEPLNRPRSRVRSKKPTKSPFLAYNQAWPIKRIQMNASDKPGWRSLRAKPSSGCRKLPIRHLHSQSEVKKNKNPCLQLSQSKNWSKLRHPSKKTSQKASLDPQKIGKFKFQSKSFWEIYTKGCLLYTSPSPRDVEESRMPSSA